MSTSPAIVQAFAPTGQLRASINLGNPILANRDPATGQPFGVSIDLARGLAQALGVGIELVVFDAAGKSVEAVEQGRADIGFFAIDPKRGEHIAFTAPYVPNGRVVGSDHYRYKLEWLAALRDHERHEVQQGETE